MAWIRTGTISISNGATAVVGSGTLFVTNGFNAGDLITFDGGAKFYEILSVNSETSLTLGTAYAESTISNGSYAAVPSITNNALASKIAALLASYQVSWGELVTWMSSNATATVTDPGGVAHTVKGAVALDAALRGTLAKTITGADVTLTALEAANGYITVSGTLSGNRSLIVPAEQSHPFVVTNNCSGAYSLTVKTATGDGVIVMQGERVMLHSTAAGVYNAVTQINGMNARNVVSTPSGIVTADNIQGAIEQLAAGVTAAVTVTSLLQSIGITNPAHISSDVTIPDYYNASSAGPIEIAEGTSVTVSDFSNWSIN